MTTKKGIQRLEGYKFYEINDPYFALIKAKDESDAVKRYIEVVAGDENDNENLLEDIKEIDMITALGKYVESFYSPVVQIDETFEEYAEFLLKEESNVLLVDGSLL